MASQAYRTAGAGGAKTRCDLARFESRSGAAMFSRVPLRLSEPTPGGYYLTSSDPKRGKAKGVLIDIHFSPYGVWHSAMGDRRHASRLEMFSVGT